VPVLQSRLMKLPIQEVKKPWGRELIWAKTKDYVGKILEVNEGHSLSLQYHQIKEETMICETGKCNLYVGEDENNLKCVTLTPGEALHITPGLRHRLEAITDCRLFEVSTPHLDDVVRLEDRYGRAQK
jgi:mannose-6-phosphate isomerase